MRVSRTRAWLVGIAVLTAGCAASDGSKANPSPGVLLRVDVSTGHRVEDSSSIIEGLAGAEPLSAVLVVAASCHNVADWVDDHILDNAIVVGGNVRLVRVAEMLSDRLVSADLALAAESQFWSAGQVQLNDELRKQGFDQQDVDEYLALVEEQPSAAALERFVVYGVSRKMTQVRITYLDTQRMPEPTTVGRLQRQKFFLATDDGLVGAQVERSQCEALQHTNG
jgi:hypothetical protein